MGYRLRVPAEIGDWLAGLRESEPAVAAEVGASLAALMAAADVPHPPLAALAHTDDERPDAADPRAEIDHAYQDMLTDLQVIRRHTAQAATAHALAELRVTELARQSGADPEELAAAIREEAVARDREEHLTRTAAGAHAEVSRFRASKEAAKAGYTAATASAELQKILAEAGEEPDEAEAAAPRQAIQDAAHRIEQLLADARSLERSASSFASGDGGLGAARPAREGPGPGDDPTLMQLRADPLGSDIRILFVIDPPGTATLLTVLEGPTAIAEDWEDAATAAGMLLEVIRDAGWPPYAGEPGGGGMEFSGAAPFLDEFFGPGGGRIAVRASQLAERTLLADLRERAGVDLPLLAAKTGLTEAGIRAMERGELREATLHELTEYLRAVGATLEVSADLNGEHQGLS